MAWQFDMVLVALQNPFRVSRSQCCHVAVSGVPCFRDCGGTGGRVLASCRLLVANQRGFSPLRYAKICVTSLACVPVLSAAFT
jgi:hypothetical protein